ncbi:MAG: SHOCT domain-containing protein [Xanthobacteraceae bacterium]
MSVDGAPGNASEPRRPPASPPNLEPDRAETAQEIDIFAKIERLADLQQKGIVSQEEFAAKKAELLSRL